MVDFSKDGPVLPKIVEPQVGTIMTEAQVFASAWSMVDGPFDDGTGYEKALEAKEELRALVEKAIRTAIDGRLENLAKMIEFGSKPASSSAWLARIIRDQKGEPC